MKKLKHYNSVEYKVHEKKINRVICTYSDENDVEYRKAFTFPAKYTFDMMINKIPKTI